MYTLEGGWARVRCTLRAGLLGVLTLVGGVGIGSGFIDRAVACAQSATGPVAHPAANDLLNATLWFQRASEYRAAALQAYHLARVNLDRAIDDPTWSAVPGDDANDGQPLAVILDVDETVLDNGSYQARLIEDGAVYRSATWKAWAEERKARAIPGALAFCKYALKRGVTVFYITNRRDDVREATRNNLATLGFPLVDDLETLLTRSGPSTKEPRRRQVAKEHRVLLMIGDSLNDFADAFERQASPARAAAVAKRVKMFGTKWIVLPNPMYGSWEGAALGDDWRARGAERRRLKIAALETKRTSRPIASPPAPTVASTGAKVPTSSGAAARSPTVSIVGKARDPRVAAGPMPAYSEMREVAIWLQLRRAGTAQIRYWIGNTPAGASLTKPYAANAANDHIVSAVITGLRSGTRYEYEIYVDGERASFPYRLSFQTQPQWLHRTEPPTFTFLTGSCAYVNDAPYDRPGRPYGGDHEIFEAMASTPADFMVWTGDNTYFRDADLSGEQAMRYRYRHTRGFGPMQRFLASMHHYAIWDDHDYGPDDSDRSFRFRAEALAIFRDYWPAKGYGTVETAGCFQRFTWGDCEFFMLDDRYHRSPNDMPDGPEKVYLGRGQTRWLKEALASSRATFKFIVNGNQVLNDHTRFESYSRFTAELAALADFIFAARVSGVVFISGDRHQSELLRRGGESAVRYPLYDFTVSPLTSGGAYQEAEKDNPQRVAGTWVTRKRNFGRVHVSGPRRDRTLTLSTHDKTGKELWRHEIKASLLRFPKR